jgi:xylulokinase
MLPFFVPEITPRVTQPAVHRFGTESFVEWGDAAAAVRAIVEAQALSMRRHSDWIGEHPTRILVTGGASRNRGILRVLADVFQAEIRPLSVANSSALGGALRAAHAARGIPWKQLFAAFVVPEEALATTPDPGTREVYEEQLGRFVEKLSTVLDAR